MKIRLLSALLFASVLVLITAFPKKNLAVAQVPGPSPVKVCEGTAIPDGWITTDEVFSQACVYPPKLPGRMLTIESYLMAKKNGTQMTVCADAPVPDGFVVLSFAKVPGKCNLLTQDPAAQPGNNMVKTIRYLLPIPTAQNKKRPAQ